MTPDVNRIDFQVIQGQGKQKVNIKKEEKKELSQRNDQQVISSGVYIPGTPLPKNTNWEATREQRRDDLGVETVQDAITQDRVASGFADVYEVKRGDTMWDIAESCRDTGRYGDMAVPQIIDHIAQHNGIEDPSKIYAGQQLNLPPSAGTVINDSPINIISNGGDDVVYNAATVNEDINITTSNKDHAEVNAFTVNGDVNLHAKNNQSTEHNVVNMYGNTTGKIEDTWFNDAGDKGVQNFVSFEGNQNSVMEDLSYSEHNMANMKGNNYSKSDDTWLNQSGDQAIHNHFNIVGDNKAISEDQTTAQHSQFNAYGENNSVIDDTVFNQPGDYASHDQQNIYGNNIASSSQIQDTDIYQKNYMGDNDASVRFGAYGDINVENEYGNNNVNTFKVGDARIETTNQFGNNSINSQYSDYTDQWAETIIGNNQLNAYSGGEVSQNAETIIGDNDLSAHSGSGRITQNSHSIMGDHYIYGNSFYGSDQTVDAEDGNAVMKNLYGDATQDMTLGGSNVTGIQETGSGKDNVTANVNGDYTTTRQNTGGNEDVATYNVTGHGNNETMRLGSDNDNANVNFDAASSNNNVSIYGGGKYADMRQDQYNVTLDGQNNTVKIEQPHLLSNKNDIMNVTVDGEWVMQNSEDSDYSHVITDSGNNRAYVGNSVMTLNVNGKEIPLNFKQSEEVRGNGSTFDVVNENEPPSIPPNEPIWI
jgi:hypothetical protein